MTRRKRLLLKVGAVLLSATVSGLGLGSGTRVDSAIVAQPVPPPVPNASKGSTGPFACVIVVDAARYDEFNLSRMPNLAALVARGTQFSQAWDGQLPSVTESSHATIGTGVLPSRHLILGDTWRVPGTNSMAPSLLGGSLVRTGYIGNSIRQTGSPTLAALVHRAYPGSRVVALSGHKVYAADALGAGDADFVSFGEKNALGHYIPAAIPGRVPDPKLLASPQLNLPTYPRVPGVEDTWTTTLALKFLFNYHPRVMMINLPEVDVFGHMAGTDASIMTPLLTNVDRQIGRIVAAYARAGMINNTTFVVTSDHGMVPALHTVSITRIENAITSSGGQALYVGHGDYSPIWLKNASAVPKAAKALADAAIPYVDAVYQKTPKGTYQLVSPVSRLADPYVRTSYSDLLSTANAAESADIVLLYDENTMTETPNFIQTKRKGDHGGATWGAQHIPLIVAGPAFKRAYTSSYPARLTDIAPTVETVMQIQPRGQDGVPLADAMIKPPAWALKQQDVAQPRMLSDVRGLENEAAIRPNIRR